MPNSLFSISFNDENVVKRVVKDLEKNHVSFSRPAHRRTDNYYPFEKGIVSVSKMELSTKDFFVLTLYSLSEKNLEILAKQHDLVYLKNEVEVLKK